MFSLMETDLIFLSITFWTKTVQLTSCGSSFLASESTPVCLVLPIVGDLGRYSRGQRALIALGAILAVLAPLAIITLLLTGSPPAGNNGPAVQQPGSTESTRTEVIPAG